MALRKSLICLSGAMGLLACGATAQDWAGPYVGFHLGGAYAEFDNSVPALPGPTGDAGSGIGGIQLGYNWQNGDVVFGPELDFSLMDLEGRSAGGRFEEDAMASLRMRVGKVAGEYMYFGSLGVAWTERTIGLTGVGSTTDYEPGLMVGGGVERFLGKSTTGRLEAFYVDVPKSNETVGGTPTAAGSDNLLFRAGVNLHF